MARHNLSIRVTGQQRDQIDPHQFAQILLDLAAAMADEASTDPTSASRNDHDQTEQETDSQ